MVFKPFVIGCAFACSLSVAVAQEVVEEQAAEQPDGGRALLEQAAAALAETESVIYEAMYYAEGGLKAMLNLEMNGRVSMLRNVDQPGTWIVRVSGEAKTKEYGVVKLEHYTKGSTTKWIDYSEEKVYARLGRVKGTVPDYGKFLRIEEVIERTPFSKVLRSKSFTVEPDELVGSTLCDVVAVMNASGSRTVWYLGKEDHFPRKVAKEISGFGAQIVEITTIQFNSEILAEEIEIQTPPGFELDSRIPSKTTSPSIRTSAKTRRPGLKVDDLAPVWEVHAADGTTVSLETMRDEMVVMWFWGTWSLESPSAADSLQESLNRFADKPIRVIALNVMERDDDAAARFLSDGGYDFTFVPDADDLVMRYRVKRYPTMFLIGYEGEIVHIVPGLSADEDLLMGLNGAIAEYFDSHPVPDAGADTQTSETGTDG